MKLLTIEETAKVLGINLFTAYRYARTGKIPAVRVGRNWRVMEETLEEWLKNKAGKDAKPWPRRKAKPPEPSGRDPLARVIGCVGSSAESDGLATDQMDLPYEGDRE
jgi:excisionase family DNA binding protein